jgi:hypothetical protein
MSLDTYTNLKTEIADWLNRSDLSSMTGTFITLAEASFKRDARLRKYQRAGEITVSADGYSLPDDFQSLESLAHEGTSHYGPVEIVGSDQLGTLKAQYGDTGVPRYAAIEDGVLYFAPEPDASYTLVLTYWRSVDALSSTNADNWLLTDHPDVYLYGSLMQAAPYLKDDERIPVWSSLLEKAIQEVHNATWNAQFSGTMRRQFKAIGG